MENAGLSGLSPCPQPLSPLELAISSEGIAWLETVFALADDDGFVPIDAAFLDGATTLTLNCFHSGGSADPWPLDDWYGAEANVDAWLEVVGRELAAQRK